MRLRFSLRTLAIFVTLVCAYFGAWEATKRYGVPQMTAASRVSGNYRILAAYSHGPMVIACFEEGPLQLPNGFTYQGQVPISKIYYLWLFGAAIRLPFDSTIEPLFNPDGELLI